MDLYVIKPQAVTDATLADASMAEDDATSAWSAATTYDIGDRCHSATTHTVYECRIDATLNVDPTDDANIYDPDTNPTGAWITVGATNRWKPFDGKISDLCTGTSDLVWNIEPASTVTAVAVLNVSAGSVRVSVADGLITATTLITADTIITEGGTSLYDEDRPMVDNSAVVDAWTYCTLPILDETEAVFQDVPGFAGTTIVIEVKAASGASRSVGEIALGYERTVGRVLNGGATGITDFSTKDYDTFGNPILVPRVFADTATYPLILPTTGVRAAKRLLASVLQAPAVYHVGEDNLAYGLLVYGWFREMPFSLDDGVYTRLNLEVEGLT